MRDKRKNKADFGWIKLHRKLLKSDMYQHLNSKQRDVMLVCLLLASHKENYWEYDGEIYSVKIGEFVTSYSSLQKNCGKDITIRNLRTAIEKLEKWNFLTKKATRSGLLISIVNFTYYQNYEGVGDMVTDKELTKNRQRTDKELTTIKNDKNVKNDKNNIAQLNAAQVYLNENSEEEPKMKKEVEERYIEFANNFYNYLFTNYPDKKFNLTDKVIKDGAKAIRILNKTDNYDLNTITAVLKYGLKDDFWYKQINSLSALTKKSKSNDMRKFYNIFQSYKSSNYFINDNKTKMVV